MKNRRKVLDTVELKKRRKKLGSGRKNCIRSGKDRRGGYTKHKKKKIGRRGHSFKFFKKVCLRKRPGKK